MDTVKTNQIEIGGKLLDLEASRLHKNVQINLVGDVEGSVETDFGNGNTVNINTNFVKGGVGSVIFYVKGTKLLALNNQHSEVVVEGKVLVIKEAR